MKKIIFAFTLLLLTAKGYCGGGYPILRDSGTQSRGTLPNARLDPSSVTLQNNSVNLSSINAAVQALQISSQTLNNKFTTSYAISDLVITTQGVNLNVVVASAAALDIQGAFIMNFASTCDLSKAGAGGLDGGVEQNKLYNLFAIASEDGTKWGAIFSTSTAPNPFPSWATKYRFLTSVPNDGSNNLMPFYQQDDMLTFLQDEPMLLTNSMATSWTDIDLSTMIGSKTKSVILSYNIDDTIGTKADTVYARFRAKDFYSPIASIPNNDVIGINYNSNVNGMAVFTNQEIMIGASRVVQYNGGSSNVGLFLALRGVRLKI